MIASVRRPASSGRKLSVRNPAHRRRAENNRAFSARRHIRRLPRRLSEDRAIEVGVALSCLTGMRRFNSRPLQHLRRGFARREVTVCEPVRMSAERFGGAIGFLILPVERYDLAMFDREGETTFLQLQRLLAEDRPPPSF